MTDKQTQIDLVKELIEKYVNRAIEYEAAVHASTAEETFTVAMSVNDARVNVYRELETLGGLK